MIVHYPGVAPCPQDAIKEILFEVYSSVEIRVFNLVLWGYTPTGRESGLKIHPVWVRIPLPLPFILRASVAVARQSLKLLWLGSNPRPSAIKTHTATFFKEQSFKLSHLK